MRWMLLLLPVIASTLLAGAQEDYDALLADYKAKKFDAALTKAESFVTDHPDYKYAGAAYYMGGTSGLQTKEYPRAETLFKAMLEKHSTNRHIDKARNSLLTALSAQRKLNACIEYASKFIKDYPDHTHADLWAFYVAQSTHRLWKFKDAERLWAQFVKDFPKSKYLAGAKRYQDAINPDIKVDEHGIVQGYDGKFANDYRFQDQIKALPSYIDNAWKTLRQTLGVDLQNQCNVVFEFTDNGLRKNSLRAQTATIALGYKPFMRITFYSEHVVLSPDDFKSRVCHELKHAAFRTRMGQTYLNLPKWVKEGLAVYGSKQLQDRQCAILGTAFFGGRKTQDLIDGIDDNDRDFNDYLEDALAFEWLNKQNPKGVQQFCNALLNGTDYQSAFAKAAGTTYAKAIAAVNDYIQSHVDELLGDAAKSLAEIKATANSKMRAKRVGAFEEWLKNEGAKKLEDWLKANPNHAYAANARYRLGKYHVLAGEYETGRKWLKQVVKKDYARSVLADDAQYWIAISHAREGNPLLADDAYGVLLRDYSWCSYAQKLNGKYSPAPAEKRPNK